MLIKTWFSLVFVILVISLLNLVFGFNLSNIFHWIYLVLLTVAITLTIIVYLEKPYKKDIKKLQDTYRDFLNRKDVQIDELQKQSNLMFKAAIKKTEQELELKKRLK